MRFQDGTSAFFGAVKQRFIDPIGLAIKEERERMKREQERKRKIEQLFKQTKDSKERKRLMDVWMFGAEPHPLTKKALEFREKAISTVERPLVEFERRGREQVERIPPTAKMFLPFLEPQTTLTTKLPKFLFQTVVGRPEERAEERRIAFRGTPQERAALFEQDIGRAAVVGALGTSLEPIHPIFKPGIPSKVIKESRKTLGVGKDSSFKDIHAAYRKQAKISHPDVGGSAEKMKAINQAYENLTNIKPPLADEPTLAEWIRSVWERFRSQPEYKTRATQPVRRGITTEVPALARTMLAKPAKLWTAPEISQAAKNLGVTEDVFKRMSGTARRRALERTLEGEVRQVAPVAPSAVGRPSERTIGMFRAPEAVLQPPAGTVKRAEPSVIGKEPLKEVPKEVPEVVGTEEQLNEVRSAIYSGDLESAKAIHASIRAPEKPPLNDLISEVEKLQAVEMGEAKAVAKETGGVHAETIQKFRSFLQIAGEKVSKETGELFREHIPRRVFGISSDEVSDALGMSENEFMQGLVKDINIASTRPSLAVVSRARGKIRTVKSMAEALKLEPEFYGILDELEAELATTPSYTKLRPYRKVSGVIVEPTPKTMRKVGERIEQAAKREADAVLKEERKGLRRIAEHIGHPSVLGKPPGVQARVLSRLIGKATTEGIDVAIAQPYSRAKTDALRATIFNSIRGYMEHQGTSGKELSKALLLSRRRGDSYAGDAIADLKPALDALSEDEAGRFAYLREHGLEGYTLALKQALNTWDRLAKRVLTSARTHKLQIGFTRNYFPHDVPEDVIKNSKARKQGLQQAVKMGWAETLTEAEHKLNQYLLRKVYRRYGHLEKPREADFPIYEKDPRKVLSSYLDSAWHRIADAEFLGPRDQIAYGLADKIGMEGGDANTVRHMLDTVLGKHIEAQVWRQIESVSGNIQVVTKFTPLTSLANLTQRLEVLPWIGPRAWMKSVFRKTTPEMKEWATRVGASFESSKKEFIRSSGGLDHLAEKYLRVIGFSPIEEMNRIFTANAGKDFVQDTFKKHLRKPNDSYRRTLERFGVDVPFAEANKKLSKQDLINASQFLNDVTQYPYRPEELPYLFNAHPLSKMLTRWKSFAFFSAKYKAKLAGEAWKEMKRGNLGMIIAMFLAYGIGSQIIGEIMNDLWAFVRRKPRDKEGFGRLFENYLWIGSVFTDLMRATRYGKAGIYSWLVGPDVGTAVDLIDSVASIARDRKTKEGIEEVKARVKPGLKFLMRQTPIFGPALPGILLPGEEGEKKEGNAILKKYGIEESGKEKDSGDEILRKYGIAP